MPITDNLPMILLVFHVLVRIDPKNATVYVVGKVEPPGRPLFVGRDLYLSGTKELRRLRNIAHETR